ncbi:hypothetical protein [Bradyrhizobium pachyrhizi]|uniref:TubC N-terminal docking domain-related protein n=1 Tax=Bradyrhizobium pachyrhizi TaxID=280333 RepID=UPI003D15F9EB
METARLLSILRERNVRVWIEGERLKCSAPLARLTQSYARHWPTESKICSPACGRRRRRRAVRPIPCPSSARMGQERSCRQFPRRFRCR